MPTPEIRLDDRLGSLERQAAATNSDLRSLFNAIEALASEVKALVARRPNVGMLSIIAIAVLGLVATITTLAFTPVYKAIERHEEIIVKNDNSIEEGVRDIGGLTASSQSFLKRQDDLLNRIYRLESKAMQEEIK